MTLSFPHTQLPERVAESQELKDLRKRSERGLTPVYGCIPYDKDRFLVVLQDSEERFHCYQYHSTIFGWELDRDKEGVGLMEMFNWLAYNHYVK